MHEKIREKIQEKNSFVIFLIKNWVFKLFLVIFLVILEILPECQES